MGSPFFITRAGLKICTNSAAARRPLTLNTFPKITTAGTTASVPHSPTPPLPHSPPRPLPHSPLMGRRPAPPP